MRLIPKGDDHLWRTTLVFTSITAATGMIGLIGFLIKAPDHWMRPGFLITFGIISTLALSKVKTPLRRPVSILLFIINTAVILAVVWMNHSNYFRSGLAFEPFAGNKILALAIGLIAPPVLILGMGAIVAAGLAPLLQFLSLSPELRQGIPVNEPWITFIYVAVAAIVYLFRLRFYQQQLASIELETRAQYLRRFSHLLINAQHLANTPLQTIENTTAVLRARHPEDAELLAIMDRALARVRNVVFLFSQCDSHINWKDVDLPQSIEEFEAQLKTLLNQIK